MLEMSTVSGLYYKKHLVTDDISRACLFDRLTSIHIRQSKYEYGFYRGGRGWPRLRWVASLFIDD